MGSLVGYRFLPTNEEIIFLLKKKRSDPDFSVHTIKEFNIYNCEPWELYRYSDIQSAEEVWYFFCEPYYKYAKSKRAHRRTNSGYWKITSTVSDVKAKNSSNVIASKRILSFYLCSPNSKTINTEWVMHEFYVEDGDPLYKKDFVVCRIEKKRDNRPRVSTHDEGQSSQDSVSSSPIHVIEDTSPKSILPPSQHLDLNGNHVAENICFKSQLIDNLISCSRNRVTENTFLKSQLPSNHNSISHFRNYVAENVSPKSQILLSHSPISHFENHVAENTSVESQAASSHSSISNGNDAAENESPKLQSLLNQQPGDTFQAESLLVAESNSQDGYNELNDASVPALHSQSYLQQELSHSNGSSKGCGYSNFQFDGKDISDMDTETFLAWVNDAIY